MYVCVRACGGFLLRILPADSLPKINGNVVAVNIYGVVVVGA